MKSRSDAEFSTGCGDKLSRMAASMYIVVEGEDPGYDIFVNGRMLARHEGALERMSMRLGVRPLLDFFSADVNSMSVLVEESGGDPVALPPLLPPQWYAPEDGLVTVQALAAALQDDPQQLGSDGLQLLRELREYEGVLRKTAERRLRWHLAVSWR